MGSCLKIFDINLLQHYYDKELIRTSLNLCNVLKIKDEELNIIAKLFPLGNTPPMLQSRNLFYTAVTRAQSMVILVGREQIIGAMVSNNRQSMRYTGLVQWLSGGGE